MVSKDKKTNLSELISLMFVMGRFMKDKMHRTMNHGKCGSLLHFETLRYVEENQRPLMRDVAGYFRITPPAATLLIDSLVREKMITRVVDPGDRRAVRVMLTRQGQHYLGESLNQRINEFKKIFKVLNESERVQFAAILKKITKNNK